MRYCVSARQSKEVLLEADEIKVFWNDRDIINDFIEDYPNKTIILEIPNDMISEVNWELMKMYNEKFNNNFYLCLKNLNDINLCKKNGIKFYWYYPVSNYYELQGVKKLGVSKVLVNAPLSFSLDKIKNLGIPIRLIPNKAYDLYIPREDGVCGQWIRPEDIKFYEEYVDVFEFYAENISTEATLLHIYRDNQTWPGNINLLIRNLHRNADNRAFPDNFGKIRTTCGQRCQETGKCSFCYRTFDFIEQLEKLHI